MYFSTRTKVTSAILLTLLCACGTLYQSGSPPYSPLDGASAPAPSLDGEPGQRTWFSSIDAYKNAVARHIMRYNTAHTFSSRLPPMLPAIVVLRITVDKDGRMTELAVQRSRDDEASAVALASMERSGTLPKPFNLVSDAGNSLTFLETFLFNSNYQFQLRTLAGPQ
jgi:protein TonB